MKKRIRRIYVAIVSELEMWLMWIKNLYFAFFTSKSRPRIFVGYNHFWFAKKYADRRTKMSSYNEVAGRKRHFVLPADDYSLVVINRLELNDLKARGKVSNKMNIEYLLKNAYYISK